MTHSSDRLNGKRSGVQQKESTLVIPTAAETIVRVEQPTAPETEEKQSPSETEQKKDESKPKPKGRRRLILLAGAGVAAVVVGIFGIR